MIIEVSHTVVWVRALHSLQQFDTDSSVTAKISGP